MKKIGLRIMIVSMICVLAVASVFICAIIQGKPLEVSPSRMLDGVDETVCDALWYASIAANSHNSQAWTVKLYPDEKRLEIRIDDTRTLAVVDPDKREAYLSLGCYLETMCTSFEAHGFDTNVSYSENSDGFTAILAYSSRENANIRSDKLSLIDKRHTDKSAFSTKAIDEETVNKLLRRYPSVLCFQNGSSQFTYLRENTLSAIKVQSADQAYRDELEKWMRFSDQEAEESLDGITAEMIGLKGVIKSLYYWTTSHESAAGEKFSKQGIAVAEKQLNGCGAFFVVIGGNSPSELVDTGRITQALWFDCTEERIAVQPMSAMLETQPFANAIQTDLSTELPVQMILRVGYVDEYGTNSGIRRALSDYIQVAYKN